jgi:hypothetical protein
MTMYSHVCPCGKKYTDDDPDLYICPDCVVERKKIASEIDRKMAGRPHRVVQSNYQIAMKSGKTINSSQGGQATFVRASDLGIRL